MMFRQLNELEEHTGSVAALFFVKRERLDYGIFLLTMCNNGWPESEKNHYTNFKLELIK